MKKAIARARIEIKTYINDCEENKDGRLYRDNWRGLVHLIDGFAHNIDNRDSLGGHNRRQKIKKVLIDYSINYLREER